jgi:hypothetical protein
MKKVILSLAAVALAVTLQAGETNQCPKAATCDKPRAECPASAGCPKQEVKGCCSKDATKAADAAKAAEKKDK